MTTAVLDRVRDLPETEIGTTSGPLIWEHRIWWAQLAGSFSKDDVFAASRWDRCAVGECRGYGDDYGSLTLDEIRLGNLFTRAVGRNEPDVALSLLTQIKAL